MNYELRKKRVFNLLPRFKNIQILYTLKARPNRIQVQTTVLCKLKAEEKIAREYVCSNCIQRRRVDMLYCNYITVFEIRPFQIPT